MKLNELMGLRGDGLFYFITQNPLNLEKLKNCIGGGFWEVWEGLNKFLKSNLWDNNLNIKIY